MDLRPLLLPLPGLEEEQGLGRALHYPAYVSETAYSSIYAFKAAVERAGSKETKAVIQVMEGMELDSPAGRRLFRKEDHQAVYDVPWGKTKADPRYPFRIMGEQKVIPASVCFSVSIAR